MRFKNIKNEHRMERRKTEATGGNWPRIDILCKHVENVYIGGKRIAWKIEVTSGWKNNEGFLISRTPSQSCESKKIGTFENLSKCEFRDRGLKSYQLEMERLIIWVIEYCFFEYCYTLMLKLKFEKWNRSVIRIFLKKICIPWISLNIKILWCKQKNKYAIVKKKIED